MTEFFHVTGLYLQSEAEHIDIPIVKR